MTLHSELLRCDHMSHNASDLEQSILRTLCWFSGFQYPLTTFEIWKWLMTPRRPYELVEVYRVLESSPYLSELMVEEYGFYALRGAPPLSAQIETRQERFLDAVRKFGKLRRASVFFQLLPGVRAIAAVNTMAWWHTKTSSDIDLFIVTKPGHIWSTRFLLVAPFALFGMRPNHHSDDGHDHGDVLDPFCFSFFASRTSIQMESLKHASEDYYLAFWTKSLVPVFDRDEVFSEFAALNKWADVVLPNGRHRTCHHLHEPARVPSVPVQFSFTEPVFRWVQQRRFPEQIRSLANVDSRVVVTDDMLKFHENDRRAQFADAYEKVIEKTL